MGSALPIRVNIYHCVLTMLTLMKTEEQRMEDFLVGLTKLTRDTGIVISGCGCCGSPRLDVLGSEEFAHEEAGYGYGYSDKVTWISPSDPYDWESYSDSIARREK